MLKLISDLWFRTRVYCWAGYVMFFTTRFEWRICRLKVFNPLVRGKRVPIRTFYSVGKKNFVLCLRVIKQYININRKGKSFISMKLERGPISSLLFIAIGVSWFCEKMHISTKFNFFDCGRFFENSITVFFQEPQFKDSAKRIKLENASFFSFYAKGVISSEYGHEIISKLVVKEKWQRQADEWTNSNIRGDWLGVHYRGTDINDDRYNCGYRIMKTTDYIAYLCEVIDERYSIFACSDRQQFIEQMHAAFPGRVFSRDIVRSQDVTPLHKGSKYAGAQQKEDAFIDILILSKAPLIYTTGSYFADLTRFFNPSIKIISLDNRRRCYKHIPNYLLVPCKPSIG